MMDCYTLWNSDALSLMYFRSADSNQNASVLHEKAKTHPYYQVLMDCRDSDYAVSAVLTLKALNKNCSRRHFNFLLLSFEENKA